MKKFAASIVLLSFIAGIYFYSKMPDLMASHWDFKGQVNGYMPKFWGLFLMPLISAGLFLLFSLIPEIDPLKANVKKFRKHFDGFIAVIILFMFYIYLLTIFWNIGFMFSMTVLTTPAFAVLLYCSGILIENAKRNWFIGIRTPWTLSSERVWDKTHKIGEKLFKASGLIAVFGMLFENYAFFFILVPVISASIYLVVYSYHEYKKERK